MLYSINARVQDANGRCILVMVQDLRGWLQCKRPQLSKLHSSNWHKDHTYSTHSGPHVFMPGIVISSNVVGTTMLRSRSCNFLRSSTTCVFATSAAQQITAASSTSVDLDMYVHTAHTHTPTHDSSTTSVLCLDLGTVFAAFSSEAFFLDGAFLESFGVHPLALARALPDGAHDYNLIKHPTTTSGLLS